MTLRHPQRTRLSKRAVEALEVRHERYIVWDKDLPGFGVRVAPSGTRTYLLQYRLPGLGRAMNAKKFTLGRHGLLTADQARELAEEALAQVRRGEDPQRHRRDLRNRPTVERLVELYLAELVRRGKKPRSIEDARQVLRLHVVPAIGKVAVADVRRADVAAIVRRLEDAGHGRTGGKVVQYARAMFNLAELDEPPWHEMRPPGTNPCRRLETNLGERRKRRLTLEEVRRLGLALRAAAEEGESPWLIGLILLWLLTGARNAEIRTARREWIDWNLGKIDLPDSKTGEKAIWLSPAAMQVVERIPALDGNPYLICGTKPGQPLVNPYKGWARLLRRAGIEPGQKGGVTPHDLRRTFASMGLGRGLSLEQIGALLGHADVQTTKGYSFLNEEPARAAARLIGAGISQLLETPAQGELFKQRADDGE